MDARLAARSISPLARDDGADLVACPLSADRLPERVLLRRAEVAEREAQEPRRSRSEAARDLSEARYSLVRAEAACGRGRRCGVRLRFRRDDVQGEADRGGCGVLRPLGRPP